VDAAKAAFYPDINLMAFLQQDALHLSDLFRHSAQQMGVTAGLTLPIFDSGRLNANLDIASAQNSLSIAQYNKAVVDAVNQVAKTASQVETLMAKSQQQQQVEKDAQRVVDLAQARMAAGSYPAPESVWRSSRRCRSASPHCACTASGLTPAFS
jgi:outer membrane protein TolC